MNKRSLETIGELTLEQSKKYCSLGIFLFVCYIWCVCMAILTWHGFLRFWPVFLLSFYKRKYRFTYMLQQQQRLRQARFSTTSWWFWLIILGDFFKNEFSLASHGLFIDKIFRGRIFSVFTHFFTRKSCYYKIPIFKKNIYWIWIYFSSICLQ